MVGILDIRSLLPSLSANTMGTQAALQGQQIPAAAQQMSLPQVMAMMDQVQPGPADRRFMDRAVAQQARRPSGELYPPTTLDPVAGNPAPQGTPLSAQEVMQMLAPAIDANKAQESKKDVDKNRAETRDMLNTIMRALAPQGGSPLRNHPFAPQGPQEGRTTLRPEYQPRSPVPPGSVPDAVVEPLAKATGLLSQHPFFPPGSQEGRTTLRSEYQRPVPLPSGQASDPAEGGALPVDAAPPLQRAAPFEVGTRASDVRTDRAAVDRAAAGRPSKSQLMDVLQRAPGLAHEGIKKVPTVGETWDAIKGAASEAEANRQAKGTWTNRFWGPRGGGNLYEGDPYSDLSQEDAPAAKGPTPSVAASPKGAVAAPRGPVGVPPQARVAPQQQQQQQGGVNTAQLEALVDRLLPPGKAPTEADKKSALNTALIVAGLTMMAGSGKSGQTTLGTLGTGGLAGLTQYLNSQKADKSARAKRHEKRADTFIKGWVELSKNDRMHRMEKARNEAAGRRTDRTIEARKELAMMKERTEAWDKYSDIMNSSNWPVDPKTGKPKLRLTGKDEQDFYRKFNRTHGGNAPIPTRLGGAPGLPDLSTREGEEGTVGAGPHKGKKYKIINGKAVVQ